MNILPIGYFFFDTEFSDFNNLIPLSIGIVSESKQEEFYKEVSDFNINFCSNFVKEVVIPLLDLNKHGQPYSQVSQSLISWINELPYKEVVFVADYMGDVVILERLISLSGAIKLQKRVKIDLIKKAFLQAMHDRNLYNHRLINKAFEALVKGIDDGLAKDPAMRHHALYDAHANCNGWIQGVNMLKQ